MPESNKRITLAARPLGMPKESDFKLVETPVPSPKAGEILVQIIYLSVDPYMRGRMNDVKSYAPPVQIGAVMGAGAVGKVVASQSVTWLGRHRTTFQPVEWIPKADGCRGTKRGSSLCVAHYGRTSSTLSSALEQRSDNLTQILLPNETD